MTIFKVFRYSLVDKETREITESTEYALEDTISKISGAEIIRSSVKNVNDFEIDNEGFYIETKIQRKGFGI